jgi:hypothetical protein
MGNVSLRERRRLSRRFFDEDPPPYDKEQSLYPDGSSIKTQKSNQSRVTQDLNFKRDDIDQSKPYQSKGIEGLWQTRVAPLKHEEKWNTIELIYHVLDERTGHRNEKRATVKNS